MQKECIECWKLFEQKNNRQQCCSDVCQKEHAKKIRKINDAKTVEHVCESCWKTFVWLKRRNLCDECWKQLKSNRINELNNNKISIKKICLRCWKEFFTVVDNAQYCSNECYQKDRYENVTKKREFHHICKYCWKEFVNSWENSQRCDNCKRIKTKAQIEASKSNYTKMIEIIKEKENVNNPSEIDRVKKKKEQTCLTNRGVKSPIQNEEIKEKIKNTNRVKRWVDYPTQDLEVVKKVVESIRKTNAARWYWSITNAELPHVKVVTWQISKANIELWEELKALWHTVELEHKLLLDDWTFKYWDILVDWNTILEYDPWNTHNTTFVVSWSNFHYYTEEESKEMKMLQIEKTKAAEKNWFRCIHMFSWDDKEKIFNMLDQNKKRIYARECDVVTFTNLSNPDLYKEISDLIDWAHLQWQLSTKNWRNVFCIALIYKWEAIATMTFWPERNKKNPEARECYRLCTKKWYIVVWWAKRMWNRFIKDINPTSVISFCDKAHFSWDVYCSLWMELEETFSPRATRCLSNIKKNRDEYEELYKSYTWKNDQLFDWTSLKKVAPFISDNYMTWAWQRYFLWFDRATKWLIWVRWKWTKNKDLAALAGYVPVYDCWQMKFVRHSDK